LEPRWGSFFGWHMLSDGAGVVGVWVAARLAEWGGQVCRIELLVLWLCWIYDARGFWGWWSLGRWSVDGVGSGLVWLCAGMKLLEAIAAVTVGLCGLRWRVVCRDRF